MRYLTFLLIGLLGACQSTETNNAIVQNNQLHIDTAENSQLQYEKLRLYPIIATEDFIEVQADLKDIKTLDQVIAHHRFRITEKKPYGRFEDAGAVNSLTVQNKSKETIFLMSGDIVEGGNQDRMIAQDVIIEPNTIRDIAVFCVERGRWQPNVQDIETDKKQFAFNGYYHVASNDLRRTMKQTGNQQEVWSKVQEITVKNDAMTSTGTYTGLEQSEAFTNERQKYLRFFDGKFEGRTDVVGIVAISGGAILGIDVFGHPQLFQKKYESLLHSYVTEAINSKNALNLEDTEVEEKVNAILNGRYQGKEDHKFTYRNKMVHFAKI